VERSGTQRDAAEPLQTVAVVKVLHRDLRRSDVIVRRFLREAKLASRLDHPYAAHIYAFGIEEHDKALWIAMERVRGVTLAEWLKLHGPMPLAHRARAARRWRPRADRARDSSPGIRPRSAVHRLRSTAASERGDGPLARELRDRHARIRRGDRWIAMRAEPAASEGLQQRRHGAPLSELAGAARALRPGSRGLRSPPRRPDHRAAAHQPAG
jgi:hypothetical protein